MRFILLLTIPTTAFLSLFAISAHAAAPPEKPMNVLLLIVDDLNTWLLEDPTRYAGKVVAPNIQRLANQGVLFHNAYTASPVCSPSRTAFLSGVAPWKSGVSRNGVKVGDSKVLHRIPSLFKTFQNRGYWIGSFGKVSHGYDTGVKYNASMKHKRTPPPPGAPLNGITRSAGGKLTERDWGATHLDENEMSDKRLADAAIEAIQQKHDKPFFISCGLFHPHYPWYVPQKYLDMYPLDEIQLPPVKKDDLIDVPDYGQKLVNLGWNEKVCKNGLERHAIQGYLASVSFSDAHAGRVLTALDESPHRDNTVVILISDHGFHLGEKQQWTKATLWEEATDSVMMWRVPGVTRPNQVCTRPVSLLDIYPTLVELAGIKKPDHLDGNSLLPLLKDVHAPRSQPAITVYDGHMSVRTEDARFIRYWDGTTELYDRKVDPHEWKNQSSNPQFAALKKKLAALLPRKDEIVEPLPSRQAGARNSTPRKSKPKREKKKSSSPKPNIVLLYIDDWAWNGTPVPMNDRMENSHMPVLQMPNVERLARQGMKFTNAYASPQCSPSRVCIQTGQSSPRNGFTVFMNDRGQDYFDEKGYPSFPVIPCISDMTIDSDALTIPEALKPLGYVSAHIGKWHMRGDPGDEGYLLHDGDTSNKPGNTLPAGTQQLLPKDLTDPKLMFSVTEKALGFMSEQAKAERPFYLQISHYAMHEGRECLPATREKYTRHPLVQAYYRKIGKTAETVKRKEDPAIWLGMGEDLDGRIGAVLDRLAELGIEDNTYVVLVSDNGYRHKELRLTKGLKQPHHAAKWWAWQGGIRVPMIVSGPGIKAGSVFQGNVVNYDFLPTFVEWAGGDPTKLKNIDGVSLASYMAGRAPTDAFLQRNLYFHYPHYRTTMPHSAIVSGNRKLLHFYERPDIPMLFDLTNDSGEVHNIASTHANEHQRLYNEMMDYFEKVGARIPKRNPNYDAAVYKNSKEYEKRIQWGPFAGSRPLEEDER